MHLSLLCTKLNKSERKVSETHVELANINTILAGVDASDAPTAEHARNFIEGAEARVATLRELESEFIQTKAE